ncbi:MAG TPA: DUF4276 family protein [Gemmataceae bacterium]|nr:DUF4276 family protein [Gemmataceae bacterium]
MAHARQKARQIALFVEGDTERGEARRRTLPVFFHKWLDPQLPPTGKVGIIPVKFQGISNYLDDLAQKVARYLDDCRANFVVGLVDLYGIPPTRVDLSQLASVKEKVIAARKYIRSLVPQKYQSFFRQHFAVHEVEAWLLAYPQEWPHQTRKQIEKRPPEQVNFNEPPAKFLKRIHGGYYKKTTTAMNLFRKVDPQIAINQCPYLKLLMMDLLTLAQRLQ